MVELRVSKSLQKGGGSIATHWSRRAEGWANNGKSHKSHSKFVKLRVSVGCVRRAHESLVKLPSSCPLRPHLSCGSTGLKNLFSSPLPWFWAACRGLLENLSSLPQSILHLPPTTLGKDGRVHGRLPYTSLKSDVLHSSLSSRPHTALVSWLVSLTAYMSFPSFSFFPPPHFPFHPRFLEGQFIFAVLTWLQGVVSCCRSLPTLYLSSLPQGPWRW